MVETEGTHSAGITESDFRKQTEATTPLGRIASHRNRTCRRLPRVLGLVVYARRDTYITGRLR